ncbi:hypothetical protein HS088_TW15G00638 [Tripterygium wilfordii]|uniref:Structural constituent of ribosome n=1 Tax=Tripterygium wilfordii TaxID=458696 RepID=A0A7J7CM86_TRIWF|nr:uncharacterized protein LOC120016223 [Tripterygium wilfordii]KAF5735138.1 hypothetical protein HS088_TW15G00638 [Tripterygium wilfordii]
MKLSRPFIARPVIAIPTPRNNAVFVEARRFSRNLRWVFEFSPLGANPPVTITRGSVHHLLLAAPVDTCSTSPEIVSKTEKLEALEENVEKVIYGCRFLTILAVFGSLIGSFLCFVKGCAYVVTSFTEYFVNNSKVILLLVEAIDVYLLGTVMLVFGMGLYELFVSNLGPAQSPSGKGVPQGSNLFGLFTLKERPRWLEIKSVNELKTKLGHVIVMLLLIGFFEKSKKAVIHSPLDLLCFSASVLLCSGCLYLLSKLVD